jgi:hypothetical protein
MSYQRMTLVDRMDIFRMLYGICQYPGKVLCLQFLLHRVILRFYRPSLEIQLLEPPDAVPAITEAAYQCFYLPSRFLLYHNFPRGKVFNLLILV